MNNCFLSEVNYLLLSVQEITLFCCSRYTRYLGSLFCCSQGKDVCIVILFAANMRRLNVSQTQLKSWSQWYKNPFFLLLEEKEIYRHYLGSWNVSLSILLASAGHVKKDQKTSQFFLAKQKKIPVSSNMVCERYLCT